MVGSWLRCYRCWSQELEVQVHYEGIHRIDPVTGERAEVVDELQEAVVQCLDCMHDQPHLGFRDGRVEPIEDRWERMIAGTPWVASCTVTVDAEEVETCSGPEAGDALSYAWRKFTQNIGEWILLWLIYLAVAIALFVVAAIVVTGGAATDVGFRFNFLGIGLGLLGGIVQGVLLVVVAKAAVMATNGQKVDIGAAFKLTSNNIVAGAVFGLIYGLANSFCFLIGIGVWMLLGFVPVISALDDKGADALGESTSLSTGHFGEAGVFMLVGWLITGCTCGIGGPIAMLGGTYLTKRLLWTLE